MKRVELPEDHNYTVECFPREATRDFEMRMRNNRIDTVVGIASAVAVIALGIIIYIWG